MFCSRMYGNHCVGVLQLWWCSFELRLRNCSLVALLMSSTDSNHAQKLLFHLSKHSVITQESLGNKTWKIVLSLLCCIDLLCSSSSGCQRCSVGHT